MQKVVVLYMEAYFFIKKFVNLLVSVILVSVALFDILYLYKIVSISSNIFIFINVFTVVLLSIGFLFYFPIIIIADNFLSKMNQDKDESFLKSNGLAFGSNVLIKKFIEKEKENRFDFCLNISNELKSYISSIVALTEIGESGVEVFDKERLLKNYSNIKNLGYKTLAAIESLITDVETSVGIVSLNTHKSYLGICVDNIISEILPLLSSKGLSIHVSGDAVAEQCYCDEAKIFKIIFNILFNSISFSPQNSNIYISISNVELILPNKGVTSGIKFLVKDNRSSLISKDILKGLSDYPLTNKGSEKILQGDLWFESCKNIIDAHYGHISFENSKGKEVGGTFSFIIPKNQDAFEIAERTYALEEHAYT